MPMPAAGLRSIFRFTSAQDRVLLLIGSLTALTSGACTPLIAFFMQDLILSLFIPNDDGSVPPHTGPHTSRDLAVLKSGLVFVGLFILCVISHFVATQCHVYVAEKQGLRIGRMFFASVLRKDLSWFETNAPGQVSTQLVTELQGLRTGMGNAVKGLQQTLSMAGLGISFAFWRDWRLALLMLSAVPPLLCVVGFCVVAISTLAKAQNDATAGACGSAEAALSQIRTVAAFGTYEKEVAKYDGWLVNAQSAGVKMGFVNGLLNGAALLLVTFAFSVALKFGSAEVVQDYEEGCWRIQPPFGDCQNGGGIVSTLFTLLVGGLGLAGVGPQISILSVARAAMLHLHTIIDEMPEEPVRGETPLEMKGRVEFLKVCMSYPSRPDVQVLDGFSLEVPAGSTCALVGRSGCGKSTIISLLQRFNTSTAGSVLIDGRDIGTLDLAWLRGKMSLVQQEPVLFGDTIYQNIAFGLPNATEEQVVNAAVAANADGFVRGFPEGYKTLIGVKGAQLSGGQKQRIAIARAIVRQPKILLLDEATSALDVESERAVQAALDKVLAQGAMTTFVVAHRLSTIKNAQMICVLEEGRVREKGTHEELLRQQNSLYASLVATQQEFHESCEVPEVHAERTEGEALPVLLGHQELPFTKKDGLKKLPGLDAFQSSIPLGSASSSLDDSDPKVPRAGCRFWALSRQDSGLIALASLGVVLSAALKPLLGWVFARATSLLSVPPARQDPSTGAWVQNYDAAKLTGSGDFLCNVLVIVGISSFLATILESWASAKATESLMRRTRLQMLMAMFRQDLSWFDGGTAGQLVEKLNSDVPLLKSYTFEGWLGVLQAGAVLVFACGVVARGSWHLALASFGLIPLFILGWFISYKHLRKTHEIESGPLVTEALGSMRTVAAFGLEEVLVRKYERLATEESRKEIQLQTWCNLASSWSSGMQPGLYLLFMLVSSALLNGGLMTPEAVLPTLFATLLSLGSFDTLQNWCNQRKTSRSAANRIFNVLDRQPDIDVADGGLVLPELAGHVEFRQVTFKYPLRPSTAVLHHLDVVVEPQSVVAFVGPSGAGKSTLIALLQRFYDPEQGMVLLDGHDLRSLKLSWLRSRMGFVQQEPALFSGSLYENISYGYHEATAAEVEAAARAANIHDFIMALPEAYKTDLGSCGARLSGGQKQRIAIARAIVRKPTLLLLDEATSALDVESERAVQEALDSLLGLRKMTAIVVAHRVSTVQHADKICVISDGCVAEEGTHSELLQRRGLYANLVSKQEKL